MKFQIVASGNAALVTTELDYCGFPITGGTPGGSNVCLYTKNTSHYGVNGRGRIRRSEDLIMWGDPVELPGQTTGFGWGPCGLAAETPEQGGRMHMLMVKTAWVPNSQTLNGVWGFYRYSDDDGLNWSEMTTLPGGASSPAWQFYPASALVLRNGDVLIAGYGYDGVVRVYRSQDRGATWGLAGTVTVAGRKLSEPQLLQLADGRIVSTIRSDGSGSDQRLYQTVWDEDWTVQSLPKVVSYNASGCPSMTEIAPGWVAIMYRGWHDLNDPTLHPLRILTVGLDANWGRGNIRLDGIPEDERFLYGSFVGDRLIVAREGRNGSTAPYASIWSQPYEVKQFA